MQSRWDTLLNRLSHPPDFRIIDRVVVKGKESKGTLRCALEGRIGILNDESCFESCHFVGESSGLYRIEHGVEIFIGGRRFVLRIEAAVCKDVLRDEFVVHGLLIERAVSGFAAHCAARTVIHRVGALFRARLCDHDHTAGARISR